MSSLRHGFGWNAFSQGVTAVTSLVLLPLVIHRLGLAAYGVFTLAMSAGGLLQQLDGGMINAATRYFGIAAGTHDRRATAHHFVTISAAVLAISCTAGACLFLLAPDVVGLFQLGRALQPGGAFAARVIAIMLPLGLFQGVVSAVLSAHGRFRTIATINLLCRVAYVATVVALVGHPDGLQEIMRINLLMQVAYLLISAPSALRLMDLRHGRLLPWRTIREIVTYSTRVQMFAVMGMINLQADALIVGAVLPVRYVGLYGTGATVASQLRSVPLNVAAPMVSRLTQTLGRAGADATFREYARLQAIWVRVTAAFSAVALGASLFQIQAWLGHRFLAAGIVCTLLLVGNLVNLPTMPLTVYLQAVGRPEIEVRYGTLSAGLNVILTVCFIWLGLYGIVGATVAGQVIGSIALLRIARAAVSPAIPSFIRPLPWLALIAGAGAGAVCGAILLAWVPWHGVPGLIAVSVCIVPGGCAFVVALLGPRRAFSTVVEALRRRSAEALIQAVFSPVG